MFEKLDYAEQFLNGEVRFSNINTFTTIPDIKRLDKDEGRGSFIYNNINHHSSFASNSVFIYCFHRTLSAAKNSKFGKYIIEINNPKELAISITEQLSIQNNKYYGGVEGINIEYTTNDIKRTKPISIERTSLIYSQKPISYIEENEFRFVIISQKSLDNYKMININNITKNCVLIF